MKKNLLLTFIMLCVISFTSSAADKHSNKASKKWNEHSKEKKALLSNLTKSSTLVSIPSTIKTSFWDASTNTWTNSGRQKDEYLNSKLMTSYSLSYDGLDTFSRIVYSYDASGRVTEILTEYNVFGVFQPQSRTTKTYPNPNDQSVISLEETYDVSLNQWVNFARTTELYDDRGNMIRNVRENYNNGIWEVSYGDAASISYLGSTNKFIQEIDSTFDNNTGVFVPTYKYTRTYNIAGQAEELNSFYYENGWVSEELDSVYYNPVNGEPSGLIIYVYDAATMNFDKVGKLDRLVWTNYDPNTDLFENQPDGYYTSIWLQNSWIDVERFSTSRPDNNGSTIELNESFENGNWVPYDRYNSLFNNNKDIIEESLETYENNIWSYDFGQKFQNQYDVNNNKTESIISYYDSFDSLFTNSLKYEFSDFISITQGIGSAKKSINAKVYPNPSKNGNINIEVLSGKASQLSVKVIALDGSLIQEISSTDKIKNLKINDLGPGFYILEISNEEGVAREKIIVE